MSVTLNSAGASHAASLVRAGKVDKSSSWSFDASDGDAMLGSGSDWANYSSWHLGIDSAAADKTKDRYKYPFGKGGKVYRSALVAIRQRAGQQNATAIFNEAGDLLDKIDGKDTDQDGKSEVEHFSCGLIEIKADGSSSSDMTFAGYGAVFGNLDAKGDVIEPGAFADTIAYSKSTGNWPAMLSQHGGMGMSAEDMTPIGIYTDMREDSKGLYVEGKFAPTPRGQEMHALMKMQPRPAINALSIGYKALKFKTGKMPDEPRRMLQQIKLIEISPVTFPANKLALIHSVKSLDEIEALSDFERYLRARGFTKSEALDFCTKFKNCVARSDSAREGNRSDSGLAEIVAALKARDKVFKP